MSLPMDLEASPIPGQKACAVLDLSGNILRGQLSSSDTTVLFQMLVEAGSISDKKGEPMIRMTVNYSDNMRYVITRDDSYVYIVQTR